MSRKMRDLPRWWGIRCRWPRRMRDVRWGGDVRCRYVGAMFDVAQDVAAQFPDLSRMLSANFDWLYMLKPNLFLRSMYMQAYRTNFILMSARSRGILA